MINKNHRKRVILVAFFVCFISLAFNKIVFSEDKNTITINNDTLYPINKLKNKAYQALNKGEYENASFLFEKYLRKNEDYTIRKDYAYSLMRLNNYESASEQLDIILTSSNNKIINQAAIKLLNNIKNTSKNKSTIAFSQKNFDIINLYNENYHFLCNKDDSTILPDGTFNRWEKEEMPLKVYLTAPSQDYNLSNPENYVYLVKEAMLKWQEESRGLIRFKFIYDKNDAQIVVKWSNYLKNIKAWGITTPPVFLPDIQKKQSVMNLSVRTPPETSKFSDESVLFNEEELKALVMHETGHALGLNNSYSSNGNYDIMSPSLHKLNIIAYDYKWGITSRDLKSLERLYTLPKNSRCKCDPNTSFDNIKLATNQIPNKVIDLRKDKGDNYLCFLPGKPKLMSDGVSYIRNYSRWEDNDFPLKVFLPKPTGIEYDIDNPEHFQEMVKSGFQKWADKLPSLIKFRFVNSEKDAKIVVKWSNYFKHEPYWGAAQTFTEGSNPNIKTKCLISLAVRAQPGWYSDKPIFFGDETFKRISIHEIGHALGLDHGPSKEGATGSGSNITDSDVNTLKKLYSIPTDYQLLCSIK